MLIVPEVAGKAAYRGALSSPRVTANLVHSIQKIPHDLQSAQANMKSCIDEIAKRIPRRSAAGSFGG